jgi:hypothetical protein
MDRETIQRLLSKRPFEPFDPENVILNEVKNLGTHSKPVLRWTDGLPLSARFFACGSE